MIPNGNLLNLNCPNEIINVVNLDHLGSISICQKPKLASNLLKRLAPLSCPSNVSTEGKTCLSRHSLAFNFVRSTQILTWPFGFGTITIPAHQSQFSHSLQFLFDLGKKWYGDCQGTDRAKGWAPCFNFIQLSLSLPNPVNNDGNISMIYCS